MPYCPKPPTSPTSTGISMGAQAPIAPQRSESGDFYPHQIRTVWSKTGTLRVRFTAPKVLGFPPLQSAPFRHAPGPGWSGVATAMPSVAQYAAPLPGEVQRHCWIPRWRFTDRPFGQTLRYSLKRASRPQRAASKPLPGPPGRARCGETSPPTVRRRS